MTSARAVTATVGSLARSRTLETAAWTAALVAISWVAGRAIASDRQLMILAVVVVPFAAIVFASVLTVRPYLLVLAAFALHLVGIPAATQPLSFVQGPSIYPSDLLVFAAIAVWLGNRVTRPGKPVGRARTPVLTWGLAVFAVAVLVGVVRGYEENGGELIGISLRTVAYAGIAGALVRLTGDELFTGLVAVFYGGAILQAVLALFYIATGGSQTESVILSTGGTRVLALSTAIFLAGSFLLAILNFAYDDRPLRRLGHAFVAVCAAYGVAVSYGRATFVALFAVVVLLFFAVGRLRRTVALALPVLAPLAATAAITLPVFAPELLSTLESRVFSGFSTDSAVEWRLHAYDAALADVRDDPLLGGGFGESYSFVAVGGGQVDVGQDPHNSFLFLLAGGGGLALGAFVLMLLAYLWDTARRLRGASGRARLLIVWSLCLWFVFVLNALTGPVLTIPSLLLAFWALMILPSAVAPRIHESEAFDDSDPAYQPSASDSPVNAFR